MNADFNADMNIVTFDSTQVENFVVSSGMYLVLYGSTHLKNSSTFLNLCIIDNENKLVNYGKTAVPFLSVHDFINVTYDISIERHTVGCGRITQEGVTRTGGREAEAVSPLRHNRKGSEG